MKHQLLFTIACLLSFSFSSFANYPDIDWMRIDSGSGVGVARDAADNVYKTFAYGIIYLTKMDKFGNFLWQQSFTTDTIFNYENPWQVHVDSKGNAVVVGERHTYSTENGSRVNALIILKYSPAGTLLWQQIIDGYFSAFYQERYHNKITSQLDANDNVYVSSGGNFAGMNTAFNTAKINAAGNVVWKKNHNFGGSTYYLVENTRIKGKFIGVCGFGLYNDNALLWMLDTSGSTLGAKASEGYAAKDVAFDKTNNVYLLANTIGATTNNDMTVYKFGGNGNQQWMHSYDFNGYEGGYKMLFAADNNLVVLGSGNQNPGGSLYSDWITFKIDTAGTLLWNKRYDKTTYNDEIPADMELDKKGNIFITGYGGPFPGGSNLGATQWVTLKYLPNGNLDWFLPIDTLSEYIAGTDLTIASDGSLFVIANLNSAIIHIVEFTGDGSCGTPANTSAINVSDDSAIVTWSAANGAYLYHLEYKPSTSTTWIKLSTDQTSYTLRSLFAGTQYDYHVQAICKGNPSTYSDTKQFTTTGEGYCNSRGLSTKNEWIDLVYLTDLINSTGNDSGYHDYTYRTATLIAGATHDLTLSAEFNGGGYTEAWSVWIDWNKDGDFEDANELIVRYKSQQIGWETTPFTVPVTALGVTKMRVAMARRNYSNPCDTFTRGEVEDYSINVVKQAFAAASGNAITNNAIMIAPNPAKDFLIVNLSSFHEKVSLLVCNAEGRTMLKQEVNNVSQTRLNISQLGKGLYLLRVADNKGGLKTFKFIKE